MILSSYYPSYTNAYSGNGSSTFAANSLNSRTNLLQLNTGWNIYLEYAGNNYASGGSSFFTSYQETVAWFSKTALSANYVVTGTYVEYSSIGGAYGTTAQSMEFHSNWNYQLDGNNGQGSLDYAWSKAYNTDGQWRKTVNWSSTGGATWGYSSTNGGFYQAFGSAPSWFTNLSGSDQIVSNGFYQWPVGNGSGISWQHSSVNSVTTTSGGASGIAAYHVFLWNSSGMTVDYTPGSTMTVPYSESGSFGFTTATRSGSGTHSGIGYGHQTAFGMNWNTQFGSYTTGMSSVGIYGDLVTYSKPAGAQDDWRWEYINGASTLSTFSTASGAVIYCLFRKLDDDWWCLLGVK